jgi:hypothetical protein
MDLLTLANPKTDKGTKYGYLTAVLHLSPARAGGVVLASGRIANVCASATPGCTAACLNTAGRGGIGLTTVGDNAIQRARRERTRLYFEDRPTFFAKLVAEIVRHSKRAERIGLVPVVRLNGTSDIRFESVRMDDGTTIFERFPSLTFYDYTKHANRRGIPANYDLTFSLAETERSWREHVLALEAGTRVAVVLSGAGDSVHPRPFPRTWNGRRLVDGDSSDLRFLDPRGVYVGLRAKGRARGDSSGFVYPLDYESEDPCRDSSSSSSSRRSESRYTTPRKRLESSSRTSSRESSRPSRSRPRSVTS